MQNTIMEVEEFGSNPSISNAHATSKLTDINANIFQICAL
jgi:hypothetical protein